MEKEGILQALTVSGVECRWYEEGVGVGYSLDWLLFCSSQKKEKKVGF